MTNPTIGALEQTVRVLASGSDEAWLQVGAPHGEDWWSLTSAAEQAGAWHDELAAARGDRRAAAAFLAAWLAQAPALGVGLPAVFGGLAPLLPLGQPWVHRHADGWFDRHAIEPLDMVEGDLPDVLAGAAAHTAALTAPVVDAVCALLPVGPAAVWGSVVDALCGHALRSARQLRRPERDVWERCQVIIDEMQRIEPVLRRRPTSFPVTWSGGIAHYLVRGTCCLHYRTCDAPDRDGDGYCATCPLRTDASRTARLRAHLEA